MGVGGGGWVEGGSFCSANLGGILSDGVGYSFCGSIPCRSGRVENAGRM